jgi:hypothetical protein
MASEDFERIVGVFAVTLPAADAARAEEVA